MAEPPPTPPPPERSRAPAREILSWCFFDFANSSYTTIIFTVVFNRYFVEVVAGSERGESLWGLNLFVSMMLVLATAPVLGAIADFRAWKKEFLFVSYVGCVVTTALLGFVGPGDVVFASILFVLSSFFFSSGENFVSSFLPELAPQEEMGRISGYGWSLGYIGGLLSLLLCLPILAAGAVTWCFPATALFFLVAGLPTFIGVRERSRGRPLPRGESIARIGFGRVLRTLGRLRRFRQLFRFFGVFIVFNAGVMNVVTFASIFARKEVAMSDEEILAFFAIVQASAALGAFLFGLMQDRIGARWTIVITLVLWMGAMIGAFFTRTPIQFHFVGNVAGLAMGATQSGSRALVATFSPLDRTAEFFGFWGFAWKLSSGLGPLGFGLLAERAGYRVAILANGGLFLVGLVGMLLIDEDEGRRTAVVAEGAPDLSEGDPAAGTGASSP